MDAIRPFSRLKSSSRYQPSSKRTSSWVCKCHYILRAKSGNVKDNAISNQKQHRNRQTESNHWSNDGECDSGYQFTSSLYPQANDPATFLIDSGAEVSILSAITFAYNKMSSDIVLAAVIASSFKTRGQNGSKPSYLL